VYCIVFSFAYDYLRPPVTTLFPYTTLFRSGSVGRIVGQFYAVNTGAGVLGSLLTGVVLLPAFRALHTLEGLALERAQRPEHGERSEEHTSELQSRENLVCRLLLEKKKKKT